MAEGLFKKAVADRADEYEVHSAGLAAFEGMSASRETMAVMKEKGIDVSKHRARRVTQELIEETDTIFVMEKVHRDMILELWPPAAGKVYLLTEFASNSELRGQSIDIPDPIRMPNDFYRQVLKMIEDSVSSIAKEF